MKYLLALFFLLVGCNGCAGLAPALKGPPSDPTITVTETIPVWIDSRFANYEKQSIRDAVQAWNTALNGYADLVVLSDTLERPADNPDVLTRRLLSKQGLTINLEATTPEALLDGRLGYFEPQSDDIFILSEKIGFRDLRKIVMHEIGHFFVGAGAPHILAKGSLMYPIEDYQNPCIDRLTAMFVAESQGWNWHYMSFCEVR